MSQSEPLHEAATRILADHAARVLADALIQAKTIEAEAFGGRVVHH